MRQPCHNCPFRSDRPFKSLRRERAKQIADSLESVFGAFHCHKTTVDSDSDSRLVVETSKPCVGALIYIEHTLPGGLDNNVWVTLGKALNQPGFSTDDLDMSSPVSHTREEFIQNAAGL